MTGSSTGIPSRTAAALAHSGWWITGGIFWLVEREDPFVRRHAAQSVAVFGALSLLIVVFGALAVASLSFVPAAFGFFTTAAAVTWLVGLALWGVAMWKATNGQEWRTGARVLGWLSALVPEHPAPEPPAPEPPGTGF
jgi:uncharacterized membrane protein